MAPPHDERDADQPPPPNDEGLRSRIQEFIPDVVKRTFLAGLGAVFTTEEGIRRFAQESHLPKEVASYFVSQAQATKKEVYRILAGELRAWLEKLDLQQVLLKLLTSLTFEINTQVRLIPSGNNLVKPEIKPRIKVKRRKLEDEEELAAEPPTPPAEPDAVEDALDDDVPEPLPPTGSSGAKSGSGSTGAGGANASGRK
ncbi:MAG TPA: hypothetical protein VGQ83_01980 [Polyangia bacterium]|jgi:hypothetical protein